jgi:hypothetical protein
VCWATTFSLIYNFVLFSLPGMKPIGFYVCSDTDPLKDSIINDRKIIYVEIFSVFLYSALNLRIKLFKKSSVSPNLFNIDENSMTNFTLNMFTIFTLMLYVLLNMKLASLKQSEMMAYPYNIFIYISSIYGSAILGVCINTFYYLKNRNLRKSICSQIMKWAFGHQVPIDPIS